MDAEEKMERLYILQRSRGIAEKKDDDVTSLDSNHEEDCGYHNTDILWKKTNKSRSIEIWSDVTLARIVAIAPCTKNLQGGKANPSTETVVNFDCALVVPGTGDRKY
uniref:Uncharacterized protein n=1 Tax=Pseudo-nitzschia australis TaxID=44445 RepID=A0A7S4EPL3_9STRA